MTGLVDLDDARALDAGVVGAKAARLAHARRAGLPALDGVVVTLDAARPAAARAGAALAEGGSGAARLAVMAGGVDAALLAALRQRSERLGPALVVRSSSPLEGAGAWAGAFASYEGVGAAELGTAVRGVWASAFTVDALERSAASGTAPASLRLAVLVQPQIDPLCGGSARALPDGTVEVLASKGSPRDLLGGWQAGVRARVAADGGTDGREAVATVGERPLQAAAVLAREARRRLGDDLVEWAWTGRHAVLLQSSVLPAAPPALRHPPGQRLDDPLALHVARIVQRFPGPLAEHLVLPWAVALPRPPSVAAVPASPDPARDLAGAGEAATQLLAEAWQAPAGEARAQAAETFRLLRGPAPQPALRRLATVRPVAPARGQAVVSLVAGAAAGMAAAGLLSQPQALWQLTAEDAAALAAGDRVAAAVPLRAAADRWEPFVWSTVTAAGRLAAGVPAVPGVAAGRVVVVDDPHQPPPVADRSVIVAEQPLPALAPLLWRAAALVCAGGSPAAHLVEVAASLGLPAVLGVDPRRWGGLQALRSGAHLAAVDGGQGVVAVAQL